MQHKRFLIAFVLLVGIALSALSAVSFAPLSAQTPLQSVPTLLPGRPISPHFPLPQALTTQFSGPNAGAQTPYSTYVRLSDDTESLAIEVPVEWRDVGSGVWTVNGKAVGVFLAAAPDLGDFYASRSGAGVFFGASRDLVGGVQVANLALSPHPAIGQMLSDEASHRPGRCQNNGRFTYHDNFYQGSYDLVLNCSSGNRGEIDLVTMPPSQEYLTLVRIHVNGQADLDVATHILDTYQVLNPSLKDDD